MKMNKNIFIVCLLVLVSLVGCKKTSETPYTEVEIGALLSLTGNWSSLGVTSQKAIELAVVDVNNYMEQKGTNIRFTGMVFDTKLDTAIAKLAMADIVRTKTKYVIGPQSSAELAAIKPLADQNDILVVSQGSTASSLANSGDGIFRFCPGDVVEGPALAATMFAEGKRVVISLSRDDEGNKGLQTNVGKAFVALGGQVDAIAPYSTSISDYSSLLSTLKSKLQNYIGAQGTAKVAVYLASFDECVTLFKQAATDPIFSSVQWYGGDGVVLSAALTADNQAAEFASATKFIAPNFGLPALAHPDLSTISSAIKTATSIEPDAYALAAYDAVWVIAKTVTAMPATGATYELTKKVFNIESSKYFGITGPLLLNAAGDRSTGSFDYWGIVLENGSYKWKLVGKSL
jgi:branched-chain amino acid transport system substrate-binding protein